MYSKSNTCHSSKGHIVFSRKTIIGENIIDYWGFAIVAGAHEIRPQSSIEDNVIFFPIFFIFIFNNSLDCKINWDVLNVVVVGQIGKRIFLDNVTADRRSGQVEPINSISELKARVIFLW